MLCIKEIDGVFSLVPAIFMDETSELINACLSI